MNKEENLKAAMERLRAKLKKRKAADTARKRKSVIRPPRYDDVFFEGMVWLDSLAYTDDYDL